MPGLSFLNKGYRPREKAILSLMLIVAPSLKSFNNRRAHLLRISLFNGKTLLQDFPEHVEGYLSPDDLVTAKTVTTPFAHIEIVS